MPERVDAHVAIGNLPVGTRFTSVAYLNNLLRVDANNLRTASYAFYEVGERFGRRVYLDRYMIDGTVEPVTDDTYAYSLGDYGPDYRFTILRYGLDGEEYYAHS